MPRLVTSGLFGDIATLKRELKNGDELTIHVNPVSVGAGGILVGASFLVFRLITEPAKDKKTASEAATVIGLPPWTVELIKAVTEPVNDKKTPSEAAKEQNAISEAAKTIGLPPWTVGLIKAVTG